MTNVSGKPVHAANRPDANILSLAAKVAQRCVELDAIDETAWYNEHPDAFAMLPPRTAKIAADLDRLEKTISAARAKAVEGLVAKAGAARALDRFGYEGIQASIVRDLIAMEDHPGEMRR
jgi:hypothetical protein